MWVYCIGLYENGLPMSNQLPVLFKAPNKIEGESLNLKRTERGLW